MLHKGSQCARDHDAHNACAPPGDAQYVTRSRIMRSLPRASHVRDASRAHVGTA